MFGKPFGLKHFAGTYVFGAICAVGNPHRHPRVVSHANAHVVRYSFHEKNGERDNCDCADDAAEEPDPLPDAAYWLKPRRTPHADTIDVRASSSERTRKRCGEGSRPLAGESCGESRVGA